MSGLLRPRAALAVLTSLCALALLGSTLVIADDNPLDCPPPETPYSNATPHGRACYERAVATHRASERPQYDVIDSYNKAGRKYESLAWKPLDIFDFDVARSLGEEVPFATHVALAKIQRVRFLGSGMADLPAMEITYETVEPVKGFLRGDEFKERVLGGPLRLEDGNDVFVTLPRRGVDRKGDLVLLFLHESGSGSYGNVNLTLRFRVDNKGNIIDDENARALNLSGKPVADLIAELRAATN